VADFESTLVPVIDNENDELDENGEIIKTRKYQKHIPNSYGIKYNCIHDNYSLPVEVFNSPNPDEVCKSFIERLEKLAEYSYKLTQNFKKKIKYTLEQKKAHHFEKHCKECNCELLLKNDDIN